MRLLLALVCFLFSITAFSNKQLTFTSSPSWIDQIKFEDKDLDDDIEGYQYLLLDFQDNLSQQKSFRHFAVKVMNPGGIQEMSDINITYDPSYQKVNFHLLQIIREGKVIDKVESSNIQIIQRESRSDRSIYDGALSVVINLEDVREGDIIEYSYSKIGFNPINKGHFSATYYQEYAVPCNRMYHRVITSKSKPLKAKYFNKAQRPEIRTLANNQEYKWDLKDIQTLVQDNNVPAWYNPYKRVQLTTFNTWKEVVDWAIPLYKTQRISIPQAIEGEKGSKERVEKLIQFVQDDIRYLGFESGIGAYKPNKPQKVLKQRFGDCKDKSLLLVALLKNEGIEAYPLLVNTVDGKVLDQKLPSNAAFDHCIAYFNFEGKDYVIDPTNSNQRGGLNNIFQADYKKGLLIKPENDELYEISPSDKSTIEINEYIVIDSIDGSATLETISIYTGQKADGVRSYFSNNSKKSIEKEYQNYYSKLYPSIKSTEAIDFYSDDERNRFTTIEKYKIDEIWSKGEDTNYLFVESFPLVLHSMIFYPKSSERTMPYYVSAPFFYKQTTQITTPEPWEFDNSAWEKKGNGYSYYKKVRGSGSKFSIIHKYDVTKEFIAADSVPSFIKEHNEIIDQLSHFVTYDKNLIGFKINWLLVVLSIIALAIGIFIAIKLYYRFDPLPNPEALNLPIGGWLVLPAIGLIFSPIVILVDLFSAEIFNNTIWKSISYTTDYENMVSGLYVFETMYDIIFTCYTVVLIIMFFKRRAGVPKLMTIFYTSNLSILLLDTAFVGLLNESYANEAYDENMTQLIRTSIGAAIWVPYFNISQRVKDTFCTTLSNKVTHEFVEEEEQIKNWQE